MIETVSKIENLLEARRQEVNALRRNGRRTMGYTCCKLPLEIPHALDIIPIRLGTASQHLMTIGKPYIHQYTCPYMKTITGQLMEEDGWFRENVDLLSGYVVCASVNRCLEVLKQYTGKPVCTVTCPLTPPGNSQAQFFFEEIDHYIRFLEDYSGTHLTRDRLAASISNYAETRRMLLTLCRLHATGEVELNWSEVQQVIHAGFLLSPEQHQDLIRSVIKEAEGKSANSRKEKKTGPGLMIIGSPILPKDYLLINVIEACGARIVVENTCTGLRSFETLVVKEPTVHGIAEAYLNSPPCAATQYIGTEEDKRLSHLLRLVRDYDVEGVVYYALRFCDPYAFKDSDIKAFLAEQAGIPMISIHSEYGDMETGRLRTRIQGFLETLSFRKKRTSGHVS